jgi:hypothetical protein
MTRITDEAGLHPKYHVAKVFDPDHKHDDCFYFVLDLTHDEVAQSAALAYSDLIARTNPVLASDLRRAVHEARKVAQPHLTDDGEASRPADREALAKVFNVCDAYERQGMGSASDFDKGAQRAAADIHNALLNALRGAS